MAFTKILVGASVALAVVGAAGGDGMAREESAVIHSIPPLSSARSAPIIDILPPLRPAIGFDETLKGARKATTAPTLEEAPRLRKAFDAPTLAEGPPPETPSGTSTIAPWDAVAPPPPLLEYGARQSDVGTSRDPCLEALARPDGEIGELATHIAPAVGPISSGPPSLMISSTPTQMCGGDVSIRTTTAATAPVVENPVVENSGVGLPTIGGALASLLILTVLIWRRLRARGATQQAAEEGVVSRMRRLFERLPLPAVVLGAKPQGADDAPAPDASILARVAVLMRGRQDEEPPAAPVNLARIARPVRTSGNAVAVPAEPILEAFGDAIEAPTMRLGDDAVTAVEPPTRPPQASPRADAGAGMGADDLDLVEPGDAVAASAAINAARTRLETLR